MSKDTKPIPKFIDDAWENMELLLNPMTYNHKEDLDVNPEKTVFTQLGMKVSLTNKNTGKPFDVIIMDCSDTEELRKRIVMMSDNIQKESNKVKYYPVEENNLKTEDLVNARKIIDQMSDGQKRNELKCAEK